MADRKILILNGPGLSATIADADRHGDITLDQIRDACAALCDELHMSLEFRQTDDMDELVQWITKDSEHYDALIINPAAGNTDIDIGRISSAIESMAYPTIPIIEVRLTNVFRDNDDPATLVRGPAGRMGFISGLGIRGYLLSIKAVAQRLEN